MTENIINKDPPQWELCKENVQPVKRGRRVKGLRLQENSKARVEDENNDEEMVFKKKLSQTEAGEEKLLVWLGYLAWARSAFPSTSAKALEVLESCTNDLKDCKSLRNDPRFIKLWIEYADLVQTPGEVFSFMQANKIGTKVALFWIAWAFVAEKLKNFGLTDKIFQKGIKMQAEPKDVMAKRYQQFQRRLARHYINMSQSEDGMTGPGNESGETQNARSSTRQALNQVGGSGAQQVMSRPTDNKNRRYKKDNFQVFNDDKEALTSKAKYERQLENDEAHISWKSLGSEKERSKENTGLVYREYRLFLTYCVFERN